MQRTDSAGQRALTREEALALKNRRTLVTLFQASWILVFVLLAAISLQIRSTTGSLPVLSAVQFLVPALATAGILASGWAVWDSLRAIRANDRVRFLARWRVALALGAAFVVIMLAVLAVNPYSGVYAQIFRVMIGYHALHALVIGVWMVQVLRNAARGAYASDDHWGVEAGVRLWAFVIAAWVLFYVVLYLL